MKSGVFGMVMHFLTRGILGMLLIYFINIYLNNQGTLVSVGINVVTFATSGALGIPGIALLYGIQFYQIL